MLASLRALFSATAPSSPLVQTLAPAAAAALALQTVVALPSVLLLRSERFYDLSGATTFVLVAWLTFWLPAARARDDGEYRGGRNWRQGCVTTAVVLWAVRLGAYLFWRVMREGKDARFDAVRRAPRRFFAAFALQAAWVLVCVLPAAALNAAPDAALAAWRHADAAVLTDRLGAALYLAGTAFEAVADWQLARWRREKEAKVHREAFLAKGLWALSRHPNYFGEVTLWLGIATFAGGALLARPVRGALGLHPLAVLALCYASPAFVAFLLFNVSGIPLTERKYDARYGKRKDYREWKNNTPVFLPKIFAALKEAWL